MDNNISDQMQNWKKQIILDPHLNCLFDHQLTAQQILQDRILTQQHEHIVRSYTKLASLKHAVTKSIQKEVELNHQHIFTAFQQLQQAQHYQSNQHGQQITSLLQQLKKFNQKYQYVQSHLQQYRNVCRLIHYIKMLEKFKVNIKIIRTMTKDIEQPSSSSTSTLTSNINPQKVARIIKQLTEICLRYDFNTIPSFEDDKLFINACRNGLYARTDKELHNVFSKRIAEVDADPEQIMKELATKVEIMNNIGKLREYLTNFYRSAMKELGDQLKEALQQKLNYAECAAVMHNHRMERMAMIFICIESVMAQLRYSIKVPNLFQTMWDKLIEFLEGIIRWNLEQEAKELPLLDLRLITESKRNDKGERSDKERNQKNQRNQKGDKNDRSSQKMSTKILNSIVWKYPILLQHLSGCMDRIHIYLLKIRHCNYKQYDYLLMKDTMVRKLIPLSRRYYQAISVNLKCQRNEQETLQICEWILTPVTDEDIFSHVLSLMGTHHKGIISKLATRIDLTRASLEVLGQLSGRE